MTASNASFALQAHRQATKYIIERIKEKFALETIADVFDLACLEKKISTEEGFTALQTYEKHGTAPEWVYNFCLDCLAGRIIIQPKGARTAKA